MIKQKCEELESVEIDKFNKDRNDKIKAKTDHIAHKHLLERNSLKQKFDAEYEMLKRQKDETVENINLKFKNRKLDLELQQKNEKNLNENEKLMKASKNAL